MLTTPSLPKVYRLNRPITQDHQISSAIDQQKQYLDALTKIITKSNESGRGELDIAEKNREISMRHPIATRQRLPINLLLDIHEITKKIRLNLSHINIAIGVHKPYRSEQQTVNLDAKLKRHVDYYKAINSFIEKELTSEPNREIDAVSSNSSSDSQNASSEYSSYSESESTLSSDSEYISESENEFEWNA